MSIPVTTERYLPVAMDCHQWLRNSMPETGACTVQNVHQSYMSHANLTSQCSAILEQYI